MLSIRNSDNKISLQSDVSLNGQAESTSFIPLGIDNTSADDKLHFVNEHVGQEPAFTGTPKTIEVITDSKRKYVIPLAKPVSVDSASSKGISKSGKSWESVEVAGTSGLDYKLNLTYFNSREEMKDEKVQCTNSL